MKKNIHVQLLIIFFIIIICKVHGQNIKLNVQNVNASPGSNNNIVKISMENSVDVSMLSFDIGNNSNALNIENITSLLNGFMANKTLYDRIILFSPGDNPIKPGNREILEISYAVDANVDLPEIPLSFDNTFAVNPEAQTIDHIESTDGTFEIPAIQQTINIRAISLFAPRTAAPDQEIGHKLEAYLQNASNISLENIFVGYYISKDNVINNSDMLLIGGRELINTIKPGQILVQNPCTQAKIPPGISEGTYYIGVLVDEFDKISEYDESDNYISQEIFISSETSIENFLSELLFSNELYPNYPNPFNPETCIRYEIPEEQQVVLEVYNITGQKVRTLVNDAQQAGSYQVHWDGRSDEQTSLPSGIYILRLKAGDFVKMRKMSFCK